MIAQCGGSLLDPQPLDEAEDRLAGAGAEHAVEMKRGERRHPGQRRQRQVVGQVLADVIDDPVDALVVLETVAGRHTPEPSPFAAGTPTPTNFGDARLSHYTRDTDERTRDRESGEAPLLRPPTHRSPVRPRQPLTVAVPNRCARSGAGCLCQR